MQVHRSCLPFWEGRPQAPVDSLSQTVFRPAHRSLTAGRQTGGLLVRQPAQGGAARWYNPRVRAALGLAAVALLAAAPTAAGRASYSEEWLAQARCIHLKEAPWTANTGNGYFGGMQFAAKTWLRAGGTRDPAFTHPGDPRYPFRASPSEQLHRAFVLWTRDGGTWRSWGAVGAACSR
jgi:hypothetical protein